MTAPHVRWLSRTSGGCPARQVATRNVRWLPATSGGYPHIGCRVISRTSGVGSYPAHRVVSLSCGKPCGPRHIRSLTYLTRRRREAKPHGTVGTKQRRGDQRGQRAVTQGKSKGRAQGLVTHTTAGATLTPGAAAVQEEQRCTQGRGAGGPVYPLCGYPLPTCGIPPPASLLLASSAKQA